jgi:hypothetical protein
LPEQHPGELERHRIRFIATTQNLDTDEKNPASMSLFRPERLLSR